jgi:uncharacterized protein YjiS (DUF1127 family)
MEGAMSTTNQIMTMHRHRVLRWSNVKRSLGEWRRRARSRNELMNLSDTSLQDIGVSRSTADFEATKPFWMV